MIGPDMTQLPARISGCRCGCGVLSSTTGELRWTVLALWYVTSPLALLVLAVLSKPSFSQNTIVLVALEALGPCTLVSAASSSYWYIRSRNGCAVPLGIPHSTQQDAQLCGYTIPCETVVICNHQAVHLNETSWNNPCEFDPERFLDEDCEQPRLLRCISNFLPFGLGTNKCYL